MSTEQTTTTTSPTDEGISDNQRVVGNAVFDALTAESSDADISEANESNGKPNLYCWANECDRDLAWQPNTAVSLIDELEPLEGIGKLTIQFISSHETLSDGEIEYNNLYLVQPFNAFLIIRGSLGEFVDDNYDFCLNATISFHDTPEAAMTAVFARQKCLALEAFDTGFHMALASLSSVDESIRVETMKQMRHRGSQLARQWRSQERIKAAAGIAVAA